MALDTLTLSIPPAWFQVARYLGHRDARAWVRSVVADALERVKYLEENVAAASISLNAAQMSTLDDALAPE